MDFLRLAYDVVQDEWDLPELDYLNSLDTSDMSAREVLKNVTKEAARKMLGHFATKASVKLLELLMEQLQRVPLPDLTGKSQVAVAEVDYEAFNSRVSHAQTPVSKVTVEGSKVRWSVSDVAVESVGDWTYKVAKGLVSDKGTYELSMAGMGFDIEADIVKDYGSYDLKMGNLNVMKGRPELNFAGSPACIVLQCVFQNAILPGLKERLPEQLEGGIKDIIHNVAPFLKQYHAYWPLAMGVVEVTSDLINSLTKGM